MSSKREAGLPELSRYRLSLRTRRCCPPGCRPLACGAGSACVAVSSSHSPAGQAPTPEAVSKFANLTVCVAFFQQYTNVKEQLWHSCYTVLRSISELFLRVYMRASPLADIFPNEISTHPLRKFTPSSREPLTFRLKVLDINPDATDTLIIRNQDNFQFYVQLKTCFNVVITFCRTTLSVHVPVYSLTPIYNVSPPCC